jgi:TnpA family transposase
VQLALLKHPGRAWSTEAVLPDAMLRYIAQQIPAAPDALSRYATRDVTRREHLGELQARFGWTVFSGQTYRDCMAWLAAAARITDQSLSLVKTLLDELRRRQILAPSLSVIERLVREGRRRARQDVFRSLGQDLTASQRSALDALLQARTDSRLTTLAWVRESDGAPTPTTIKRRLERLQFLHRLGLPMEWATRVHPNRLQQLAREGFRVSVSHLRQYEPERRYGTLVAMVLDSMATVTDDVVGLHERVFGHTFKKAERTHLERFQASGRAINEKVVLYAKVGHALIEARKQAMDPYEAIETVVPWERFTRTVKDAESLAHAEDFDYLEGLTDYYASLRRYTPVLLETLSFQPTAASNDLMEALTVLREANARPKTELPATVPTSFVSKRWAPHVFTARGVDRRFYELCTLTALTHALRSGDLAVKGSRQFQDFEKYLVSRDSFQALARDHALPVAVDTDFESYFAKRTARLENELRRVDALAARNALPEARILNEGLTIQPMASDVTEEVEQWSERAYLVVPKVRITDLLVEVDQWTHFTRMFTHLRTGTPSNDPRVLLTAILADGINLGLTRMSHACPGTSPARLIHTSDWYIRDETYSAALAEIVNYHQQLPLALEWGRGTTSSSDAQRYPTGGHGEATGHINARYGHIPSVMFYTHVSDQYAPFYTNVIHATVRDATHVLDGLLYHETGLRIEEHYTDTAGFTDHVFALCHLLGFRFAPRIRDLAEKRLYLPGKQMRFPALAGLVGGVLNRRLIERHWGELLRLATSIKHGTVTASLMLRKLGAYPRQNGLAQALREVGRLERSLFMLQWLQDLDLRRRVQAGLNKGEARNALAKAVFFNRLGEVRERSYEDQRYRASGLNLVVAAIVLWNTVYLERAVEKLRALKLRFPEELATHLSPLAWSHISLTGDYIWRTDGGVKPGQLRPMRELPASLLNS